MGRTEKVCVLISPGGEAAEKRVRDREMQKQRQRWGKQSCDTLCMRSVSSVMSDSLQLYGQAPLSMGFSGKNTGVGCHALLQGILQTQRLNRSIL